MSSMRDQDHALSMQQAISLVSNLLDAAHDMNERLRQRGPIQVDRTPFHASRIPKMLVPDYIERLTTYLKFSPEVLLIAAYYIQKVTAGAEGFRPVGDLDVTAYTVHRLLITSVLIASKLFEDVFFSNEFYAEVGGLTTAELNVLELDMFKRLSFTAYIRVDEFQRFVQSLPTRALEPEVVRTVTFRKIRTCSKEDTVIHVRHDLSPCVKPFRHSDSTTYD
eukprot:GILJ01004501.1.p1 GENE.GILJ01004501.1~~GILJ01004501.1.p1  ORF type:complete len:221 (-),score=22.83 GILJ01004501.1:344-1006(-)